jgi:YegS/Rv2252/BmrU family lipid kinase
MSAKTYWFIVNPVSGNAPDLPKLLGMIRQKMGAIPRLQYAIHQTEAAGHACRLAQEAVKERVDVVASVGGDGTMNEVAGALIGSNTALGLIPRGSGNGFARSLQISMQADQALDMLLRAEVIPVDAGKINDNYFFGVAGVGLDAQISYRFQHFGKRGPLPYFYIGLKEFLKYQYEEFEINAGERVFKTRPLLVAIANTPQYGNGAIIAPGASNSDGLLDVCIIEKTSALQLALKLDRLFTGEIDTVPFYSRFLARELTIRRENAAGFFHTDGEPHLGNHELHISVMAKKLNVCVSPEAALHAKIA